MATPEWVPLSEGFRIFGRHLVGSPRDDFSQDVRSEAAGRLLAALREGKIKSEGWRDQGEKRESLPIECWRDMRANIDRSWLDPMQQSMRRLAFDRISGIVVDADDVRCLLTGLVAHTRAEQVPRPKTNSPSDASAREGGSPDSEEKIREALRKRVAIWPSDKPQPGGDADWKHVEVLLEHKVDRETVRRLRVGIVPGADEPGRRRNPKN